MKKYLSILLIIISLIFVACSSNEYNGKFSYSPQDSQAGDEILIKYKSDDDRINNSEEIKMIVYSFSSELTSTTKVDLEKKGSGWMGKFTSKNNAKGMVIKFLSKNGNDNNNEMGYVVKLKDEKGNEVAGANAGLASVYVRYAGTIDLTAARDSASKLFELEFAKNPDLKRKFLSEYINSFPRSKRTVVAQAELEMLEKEDYLSQKDIETLSNGFKTNREYDKAEKYYQMLIEKYPESRLIASKFYGRFRNMLTTERMMEVFTEFSSLNPESDLNNYMVSGIVKKFALNGDQKNVDKMLSEYSQFTNSNIYNSLAWDMFEGGSNLTKASDLCETGLKMARQEFESPSGEQPVYMDEEDWKGSKKYSLAMILNTYGNIQNKVDKKEEALKLFEEAVELTGKGQPDINENYTSLLFELGKNEKAQLLIEELISKGKATGNMKDILNQIFTDDGGSEKKFEEYVSKFEGEDKQGLIAKFKEEMKNEVAPEFELLDMNGNTVKLADFKGKTVVVDFWATWCGPCLRSFPAMKKAVEKYADDTTVEFLFVNTRERVEDKKSNAADFLKRSKYPFNVLLDDQNEVAEMFEVSGIPTKFVVDGKGKIRFKSVGFSGIESEVLEELDLMIAMTK